QVIASRVGGTGQVIGLDKSKTMIEAATERTDKLALPIQFRQGDAHCLPFPVNYFDRAYALRLFEIVSEPRKVLKELFRVTKPGGRVFVNGPDVDMWTFDVEDRDLTRRILSHICDHEINGWIGRQMPRLFSEMGFADVKVMVNTMYVPFELAHDLYLKDVIGG